MSDKKITELNSTVTVIGTDLTVVVIDPTTTPETKKITIADLQSSMAHSLLSATHGDTLVGAVVDGDVVIGNVTPKWSRLAISVPAANVRNVLGVDNAELRPSWKIALDATNPTAILVGGAADPGTSLIFSHRDHTHSAPATWTPSTHDIVTLHTYTGGTALDVFGLSAPNTIARLTPSSNPGAAAAILASDASGQLTLVNLLANGATFNLVNATATTVNFAGAATTINLGAASCVVNGAGGLTINGGIAANDDITIQGTSHATRDTSYVLLQPSGGNVGIGTTNPGTKLDVTVADDGQNAIYLKNTGSTHGFGGIVPTTVYAQFLPSDGLFLRGFSSGDNTAFNFEGYMDSANPTDTTPAIIMRGGKSDGAGGTIWLGASETVWQLQNFSFPLVTVLGNGNVGIGANAPITLLHALLTDATTNSVVNAFTLGKNVTGAGVGANGLGIGTVYTLESSTTIDTLAALDETLWVDATHATRKARRVLSVYDTAVREAMRIEASGAVAMIGFLGASAIVRPAALTTQLTTLTHSAPGTPDYAIQDPVTVTGYGFVTLDEALTVLSTIANLQTRVAELEDKLGHTAGLGLITH